MSITRRELSNSSQFTATKNKKLLVKQLAFGEGSTMYKFAELDYSNFDFSVNKLSLAQFRRQAERINFLKKGFHVQSTQSIFAGDCCFHYYPLGNLILFVIIPWIDSKFYFNTLFITLLCRYADVSQRIEEASCFKYSPNQDRAGSMESYRSPGGLTIHTELPRSPLCDTSRVAQHHCRE